MERPFSDCHVKDNFWLSSFSFRVINKNDRLKCFVLPARELRPVGSFDGCELLMDGYNRVRNSLTSMEAD